MTLEEYEMAKEIMMKIQEHEKEIMILNGRASRVNEYIELAKKKDSKVTFAGKEHDRISMRFIFNNPTESDVRDMFSLIDDNKADFLAFLKKSVSNYEKEIKRHEKEIADLKETFASIGLREGAVA